ncbi:signal-regulatory protein beta-2-like [Anabas testudineus]|uniref:signal-regulatory protein beta-2-like n=1 Tax=Anabas testudineus TaxID=64144 RepID=UPI000E462B41|nr:signal-regulatory protein beta-2-like [Anabas testudineus]
MTRKDSAFLRKPLPEFLGGIFSFDFAGVNETPQHQTPRITAKQEHGTFVLIISKTELSDTGLYYCIKVEQLDMRFLKGIFLRVKGPEPDITAVIQDSVSDPVRPGDSVTLQCSVFSDSNNKTCSLNHNVYWFRAGSDSSHPSLIYTQENSGDQCEKSSEARSPQKCVYSFSKNISSSDSGTYYCAVATCGQILFGNGTKMDTEGKKVNVKLLQLFVLLALSLIGIAFLVHAMKNNNGDYYSEYKTTLQNSCGPQKRKKRDEDTVYSAVVFTVIKAEVGMKDSNGTE